MKSIDWSRWRAEFPVTEHLVHLNHAGLSPLPLRVVAAIETFGREAARLEPETEERWSQRAGEVRAAFARLVGAQPAEIAFVTNTAEGISLVAAGLDWRAGDNVVAVDGEYPSNVYPWLGLQRHRVETRLVPAPAGIVEPEAIARAMDTRTRVVAVSFVDWRTGARTDLPRIAALCRDRGALFCVDGIQGVGALRLDVEAAGIDCLAVGGHKWLLAPEGCGCLFVSRRVLDRVQPVLLGWKSVENADRYLPYHFGLRADAAKFEPGSPPHLGIHGLGAALDLLLPQAIEERILSLTARLIDALQRRGAQVLSPLGEGQRSGIVLFRLGPDPEGLCAFLQERGIVVRVRNGGIRVTPHFYNDEGDLDRLLAAVDDWRERAPFATPRRSPPQP